MSEKFTPGPWVAENVLGVWLVGIEETKHLLTKIPAGSIDAEANARLIAAAPDLLAQLETAATWIEQIESYEIFDPSAPSKHELLPQLRAAIAKARGGAE